MLTSSEEVLPEFSNCRNDSAVIATPLNSAGQVSAFFAWCMDTGPSGGGSHAAGLSGVGARPADVLSRSAFCDEAIAVPMGEYRDSRRRREQPYSRSFPRVALPALAGLLTARRTSGTLINADTCGAL